MSNTPRQTRPHRLHALSAAALAIAITMLSSGCASVFLTTFGGKRQASTVVCAQVGDPIDAFHNGRYYISRIDSTGVYLAREPGGPDWRLEPIVGDSVSMGNNVWLHIRRVDLRRNPPCVDLQLTHDSRGMRKLAF